MPRASRNPDALFTCRRLDCMLRKAVCIRRQLEVARELRGDLKPRSSRRKRGIAPEFVACRACPQGERIRAALGDACASEVRTGDRGAAAHVAIRAAERERSPCELTIW